MNAVFTTVESVNSQEPVDTILNRVYTMQYTQPDSCLALLENLEFERSDELSPTNRAMVYYYQGNNADDGSSHFPRHTIRKMEKRVRTS